MIWYLPGCDVRTKHPEAVQKLSSHLHKSDINELICCRKDISDLHNGDTLLINCTQCHMIMDERTPHVQLLYTFEYVLHDPTWEWPNYQGLTMSLQDCWRMRNNRTMLEAIRTCLEKMNIHVIELEHNYEKADFCGVWLNNPANKECVRVAPNTFADLETYRHLLSPEDQVKKMQDYVSQFKTKDIIVYCSGCEKGIQMGGGHAIHLIDLITGIYQPQ